MRFYTDREVSSLVYENMDVLLVASAKDNTIQVIKCSDVFSDFISDIDSYSSLIEKLWFHMSDSNARITDDYHVFVPKMGEFNGKFASKIDVDICGEKHLVQMLVCPIDLEEGIYSMILCDLDDSEYARKQNAEKKAKTIQETYLFSMYVDLNRDMTSSINISEISNDDMHYEVKYSEWRMMIVNMIWPEDQTTFLGKSDPEYLKSHLAPGKTFSFDCQMKNLEGNYIWVKLIFGRTDTTSEQDFRFVFMVENIHESSMQVFTELKKFERLASYDALTDVFNHGRIETELNNAISDLNAAGTPVSLMMLDIDFFKNVNDTYGHAVGDEVLKEFVQSVKEILKRYNISIGRWGGEEFVCVCHGWELDALQIVAEKVRETVAETQFQSIGSMTCSIGISDVRKDDTANTAFVRLDTALYQAKSDGRNCIRRNTK